MDSITALSRFSNQLPSLYYLIILRTCVVWAWFFVLGSPPSLEPLTRESNKSFPSSPIVEVVSVPLRNDLRNEQSKHCKGVALSQHIEQRSTVQYSSVQYSRLER